MPTRTASVVDTWTPIPTNETGVINVDPKATVPSELQGFADQAKADLAARLGVDVNQIEVLEAIEVVWPDASLGCPQPGMAYAQVSQDGLLIRLSAGGRMYFYHSGGTGDLFLCEHTSGIVPGVTPKTDEFVPPPDTEID